MKKIVVALLSLVMMAMTFTACGGGGDSGGSAGGDQDVITIKVAVQQNEEHETCKAVRRAAEKIEEETGGAVVLEIYSDSSLGDYTAVFDEVMQGTIDMAVQSISGEYDPALELFYLPYLFTNYEESRQVFTEGSNTYQLIQDKFDSYGLKYLGIFVEGFVQVATVVPVDNMADVSAKKTQLIRCPAIESGRLAMDCQGFPTITIPYSDLYTSLQTGVCDGWMGGTAELNYVAFADVIKYLYVVNQQMENNSAFINKDLWDSIPAEYQEIISAAFEEESLASFDRAEQNDIDNLAKLEEAGVTIVKLSQDELDAMAAWVREKTWDKDFEMMGDDVQEAISADMGW